MQPVDNIMRRDNHPSSRPAPSLRERCLSVSLLAVLAVIALAVAAIQFRYDTGSWRERTLQAARPPESSLPNDANTGLAVAGLQPMTSPEHYNAVRLSDKIDGKAELYLSAGFEGLETRRFAVAAQPSRWMEIFIYEMRRNDGAFAVYSQQRRGQAQPLDLSADAYRSANGIFLVQGRYYVEIIASDAADATLAQMTALARAFIRQHPAAASARADERTLFPQDDLVADSIALTPEHAFGFEPFNRLFSAQYRTQAGAAAAFLSRRASTAEAAELADAYIAFLLEYGGMRIDPPAGAPPVVIIEIMDMVEIVFHDGDMLAGVHEADDLTYALALAEKLYRNVKEADREP